MCFRQTADFVEDTHQPVAQQYLISLQQLHCDQSDTSFGVSSKERSRLQAGDSQDRSRCFDAVSMYYRFENDKIPTKTSTAVLIRFRTAWSFDHEHKLAGKAPLSNSLTSQSEVHYGAVSRTDTAHSE